MVIGIDVSRANTKNRTGVEEYVFQVCTYACMIVSEYSDVTLVLYTRESLIADLSAVIPDTVKVKILTWPLRHFWTQIRLSWEMLTHPPDVLFVPGHVFPLIHPKKTIMTIHDIAASTFPESYSWFERWYSLWSARVAVQSLWKCIAISEFTKKEIGRWVTNNDTVFVVPLACDDIYHVIDDIEGTKTVVRKYGITTSFILSIGRLETKKNTVRIIQAFNNLKSNIPSSFSDVQLVLVGGKGYGAERVFEEIEKSPYKKDIVLLGYVDKEDLPYLLNAADVFVFPSLYEGFGIPILEAFACGTPVVTSNTTGCTEVAGDGAVRVDPLDVGSIAKGIEEAMHGLTVDKGLMRVQGYLWEKTVRELFAILRAQ